jgi:hypothetical protein
LQQREGWSLVVVVTQKKKDKSGAMSESTRSHDYSPDQNFSTWIPINLWDKGMVLRKYSNLEPVPIPEHTRDHIITVLPVPLPCLTQGKYSI